MGRLGYPAGVAVHPWSAAEVWVACHVWRGACRGDTFFGLVLCPTLQWCSFIPGFCFYYASRRGEQNVRSSIAIKGQGMNRSEEEGEEPLL